MIKKKKMIKKFDSFVNENYQNESWRQVKAWLKIPQILFEMILSKLIDFVPRLGVKYDSMAAKIDTGTSFNSGGGDVMKEEPIKLTIDDVKNDKMRKTLKMTGIFDEWNVYTFDRQQENRQPIYITKDELHKGDHYYGERISESTVDKNYGRGERRYLKSKGAENISELEPQFWVVVAVHSEEHDEMSKEREARYTEKEQKDLEKHVKKHIKEDRILGRSSSFAGGFNNNPIAFKVVEADRIDLMKQLIDGCIDNDEIDNMVNANVDSDGWETSSNGWDKYLPTTIKSVEMAKLLTPYIMKDVAKNNKWISKIKNEEVKKYFQDINWE